MTDYRYTPEPRIDPTIDMGYKSIHAMERLLSGKSIFTGLQDTVEELRSSAPEGHDVVVIAYNISVEKVRFIEPHTLVFSGLNSDGHRTVTFIHYTQMVAQVISRPKKGASRIITGFSPFIESANNGDA